VNLDLHFHAQWDASADQCPMAINDNRLTVTLQWFIYTVSRDNNLQGHTSTSALFLQAPLFNSFVQDWGDFQRKVSRCRELSSLPLGNQNYEYRAVTESRLSQGIGNLSTRTIGRKTPCSPSWNTEGPSALVLKQAETTIPFSKRTANLTIFCFRERLHGFGRNVPECSC